MSRLPPGPHRLPRELVRDNQRRRILLAALEVFAERGVATATVKDLIRRAHVSRATFYESFADKEACLVALHEDVLDWIWEEVAGAVTESADWPGQVRVAVTRTLELLAADPRLAVICVVEGPATTVPQVRARHERMIEELSRSLRAGRAEIRHGEELPEILEAGLVHGAIYLAGRSVVYREGPDPVTLGKEIAELLLFPYSG